MRELVYIEHKNPGPPSRGTGASNRIEGNVLPNFNGNP